MVSSARKNLLEDIPPFPGSGRIMFAVSLVTIHGIFNGFYSPAAKLIDNSSADIWVASETLVHVDPGCQLLTNLIQAQQVGGVERAEALLEEPCGVTPWAINPVRVIGFDPNGQLYTEKYHTGSIPQTAYTVTVDTTNFELLVRRVGDVAVGSLPAR